MKTRYKYNIKAMTGRMDDRVYYYHPGLDCILSRKYVKQQPNAQAQRYKIIMANLKTLNPSAAYIRNFKDYAILYNKLCSNRNKAECNWRNLFIKMMFAMAKANPDIDLATLSREQIHENNLPCITVKAAIEAGLLPNVRNSGRFIELI